VALCSVDADSLFFYAFFLVRLYAVLSEINKLPMCCTLWNLLGDCV